MAFQITDDILDYCGDPAEIGKPTGENLAQGLFTMPLFYHMEQYPNDKRIIDIQRDNGRSEETVHQLVEEITSSSAIENQSRKLNG